MSLVYGVLNGLYSIMQIITGAIAIYQLALSVFGFWVKKEKIIHGPTKRFAVIVPAHNEERVVGPLIDSLTSQHYPSELFDIHLIADNCTDHTADVGRMHGAIVHERTNNEEQGKGYAIEWILQQIVASGERYDAIVMFDADNLVDPEFLNIMNDKLCRGNKVIQGYLGVKNPFDTWVSVSLAITYWFDNRMWQKARQNLGISCALGGTGLCIDYPLLQEMGWKATGLTEDLEFGVRCVNRGIIPMWAHEAKVYDEKPTSFMASFRQRLRWQQGHFQCAKEHMVPLLKDGIRERNLAKFDTGIYLFQPMRSMILFVAAMVMFVVQYVMPKQAIDTSSWQLMPTSVWVTVNVLLFAQMPIAMLLERVNWRAYFGLITLPFFLWTWGPVTLQAYFTRSNRKWYHTAHKRAIRLDQLKSR
ncbi:glycosyltransferase family 2 protein [Alicyclobacillus dauci]|uniref:Glycosyltransferase family 2 protein n=1 Tax=Alicyclobacillus dauci TaxID=1475485 RepID=A0ABY6YX09_9BACL|nr:glycosyltransferase family 2 protein [Alicyclobacillus dauci]WAH35112.1 glycosyltransferase family 2 protein [Alicyclobacillus dauci]